MVESAAAFRKAGRSSAGISPWRACRHDAHHGAEQVLGHPAVLDDFVELAGQHRARVVLEAVDHAGLRRHVELAEGNGRGNRAHDLEGLDEGRRGQHAQLDVLDVGQRLHRLLGVHVARAVVRAPGDDLAARALDQHVVELGAHAAVQRLGHVLVAVEQVAQVQHAELRRHRGPDRRAREHHVDGAHLHLLHHVAFLAELVVGKVVDADLVAHRLLQVGLHQLRPGEVRGIEVGQMRGRQAQRHGLALAPGRRKARRGHGSDSGGR
jgi:hypothetical protein